MHVDLWAMRMTDRHESAREMYEERSAIREYYAGYPKAEAERLAKTEVANWLKAHPQEKGEK